MNPPTTPPSPNRGLLANPGFERQKLRAAYFFAGNWRFHGDKGDHDPLTFYEFAADPNFQVFTVFPTNPQHLGWSENAANRDFAIREMLEVGTNVVVMSFWGERGNDRWVLSAPMHTSTFAHDQLFNATLGKDLLIMPAIESGNGTLGGFFSGRPGLFQSYNFAADFPHSAHDGRVAPQLVLQIEDLIRRYVTHPANPDWPAKWARMFDRDGKARLAINLIHVGSTTSGVTDAEFERAFDQVALDVLERTGELVGFTLDTLKYRVGNIADGDVRGWQQWFPIHPETIFDPGGRITALWRNEHHLDLFAVGLDGAVRSIWYDLEEPGGYRPEGWFAIHPEKTFDATAPITAIWTGNTHLDLFVTDPDGALQSIWYDEDEPGGFRPEGWFAIHPETPLAASAPITALWAPDAAGEHLDLFATDADGAVVSIWWDDDEPAGFRPEGWFQIHGETRTAPGAPIAALWHDSDHLDLFMIGRDDGAVMSTWFDDNEGFRPDGWFSIGHPVDRPFKVGGNLTALWRNEDHLDFFATDGGQTVWSTWFDVDEGFRADGWFAIRPEFAAQPNAPVIATWQSSDVLDLFVMDGDGQPLTIDFNAHDPTDHPDGYYRFGWFPLQRGTTVGRDAPLAVPRAADGEIDLFAISPSGAVISTSRRRIEVVYRANPKPGGLSSIAAVLAIQMFIPEIFDCATSEDGLFEFKRLLLETWRLSDVPVILDLSPGYNGEKVFPGSKKWGNNDPWRDRLTTLWTFAPRDAFVGIAYNSWNGYTEGSVAMHNDRSRDDDHRWIKRLFQLVKAG